MSSALKILFICNKSPWPAREGGPIAMLNLINGLISAGHKVKILAVNSNKYNIDPDEIPPEFIEQTGLELVEIDLSVKVFPALVNLLLQRSYHVRRFISEPYREKLTNILRSTDFDVVQVELVYMSPYLSTIRQYSKAKIFLRAHNIEHLVWDRIAAGTENKIKRFYIRQLVKTLRKYELSVLNQYDGIIPITKKDASFFFNHCSKPVFPVTFGIETKKIESVEYLNVENAIFHIGSMNWVPNEEGIRWFLSEVWPLLHNNLKDLKLYLAGREMPDWLTNLSLQNVIVLGEVKDAAEFIRSKSICIAPLLSGSGIRVKIIESMALGKAVVSTTVGAEGINYTYGSNILIADSPQDFYHSVKFLYENPGKVSEIGTNARQLIEKDHSTEKIIEELVSFYRQNL